jgi:RNA polymerase sigma factor (sigma-70 family)
MAVEPIVDESWEADVAAARSRVLGPRLIGGDRVSDELLARLVASGGERHFRALYERYRQSLYGYCHSILRNEADAQDALQSTFTKALMALREGRRNAPLRPWLYRIAHNEAISIVRDRGATEKRLARVPRRVDVPSVEERAGDRARLSSLLDDLSQLPDRARGALVMREMGGLSHEEIAAALGLSVGGAKQAIFEARRGLLELAEGRAMSCDDVTRRLSDGDRRAFRGRRVRAHLRDCRACAAFAAAIPRRHGELRALSPVLAPASAAAVLERILGGAAKPGAGSAGAAGSGSGSTSGAAGSGSGSGSAGAAVPGSGSGSAGTVGAGSGSASAGTVGSGSAGAAGSGAGAAAAGSSSAGGWTVVGLVAKPLLPALVPKALLALTVSAGVAAGGVAVGVSGGHPARPSSAATQTGGATRSGHTKGFQASAPNGAAVTQSTRGSDSSQPGAGTPGNQRTGPTGCGRCGAKPNSHSDAPDNHSASPAHPVAPRRQDNASPGESWHSSAAASHSSAAAPHSSPAASHASGGASHFSATASHTSPGASHSAASAAHTAHASVSHANPRSGGSGNSHSAEHSTGPGGSHGGGHYTNSVLNAVR